MDREDYVIGAEYISDTAAHTGRFVELYALEATVIASAVSPIVTGNTFTSVPISAGGRIRGLFTSVTLASGKIIAHKL